MWLSGKPCAAMHQLNVDLVEPGRGRVKMQMMIFLQREGGRDYQVMDDDYQLCRLYVESVGRSRSQIVSRRANVASARCNVANVASTPRREKENIRGIRGGLKIQKDRSYDCCYHCSHRSHHHHHHIVYFLFTKIQFASVLVGYNNLLGPKMQKGAQRGTR